MTGLLIETKWLSTHSFQIKWENLVIGKAVRGKDNNFTVKNRKLEVSPINSCVDLILQQINKNKSLPKDKKCCREDMRIHTYDKEKKVIYHCRKCKKWFYSFPPIPTYRILEEIENSQKESYYLQKKGA